MTSAEKASNMNRLTQEQYQQLIMNFMTSLYKKANSNIKNQINMAGKNLMRNNEVIEKMERNGKGNSFITIKDHKIFFYNLSTVRLINPAKNEPVE